MGAFRLKMLPVILDVLLQCSVTEARIKIVVLHLFISMIVIPFIVVESIHRSHHTSPMTATCTVNIERPVAFLFSYVQKRFDAFVFRVVFITHWNIEIIHMVSLGCFLSKRQRVVSQVYDCLYA